MAKSPEARLSSQIRAFLLEKVGGVWVKNHSHALTGSGRPDIEGLVKGHHFSFETKLPGQEKTLTPIQKYKLRKYKAAGSNVALVTSKQEALSIVRRVIGE